LRRISGIFRSVSAAATAESWLSAALQEGGTCVSKPLSAGIPNSSGDCLWLLLVEGLPAKADFTTAADCNCCCWYNKLVIANWL